MDQCFGLNFNSQKETKLRILLQIRIRYPKQLGYGMY